MSPESPVRGVLFDLDGTLLDTAPDLIFALNAALLERGVEPRGADEVKPLISGGAAAMIRYSLNGRPAEFASVLERMLELYGENIAVRTRFFDGTEEVLARLDASGIPWGIVTNKIERFTQPLLRAIGLDARTACIVSGDTTSEHKPHPLPMLEACRRLGLRPEECVYVGDAERDIDAGRRAGTATLAALYGYLSEGDAPESWGADGLLSRPGDLLLWLAGKVR